MRRAFPENEARLENDLTFERERLLNLIDSKIRRREMEDAKGFAEELFRAEVEFALLRKTEKLGRYNRILLKCMVFLIGVLFASILCVVLNINPSFYLCVHGIAVVSLISAIVLNGVLQKRFGQALKILVDAYESVKQSFINGLLEGLMNGRNYVARIDLLIGASSEGRQFNAG